jgi:hypothetical protein
MLEPRLVHFIDEPIEVIFYKPPLYEKTPTCPDGFIWREKQYLVTRLLSEWHDFARRGHMGSNMRPEHAAAAQVRGSLGVGRFHFVAVCDDQHVYEFYYDRAPKSVNDKKGRWVLVGERDPQIPGD